jgi:DNA-binding CsgD family transcriptional regulator
MMRAVSKSAVPDRLWPLRASRPEEHTADRPEAAEVRRLVRGLLLQVTEAPMARAASDNGGQGVVLDLVVDGFRCVVTRLAQEPAGGLLLSPREMEIARMVAKGYPNKTIAAVLEISSWTVSTHLRRMFAKLGVTSRAAMVARLMES